MKLEKLVGWGDPQYESNEVVTDLGVGNLPNNQNTNVGVGLEVGNSFGVGRRETGRKVTRAERKKEKKRR